jgi:hypothetical protein
MSNSNLSSPNLALSLFTIHKIVTRGLQVSIERAQDFLEAGFPDDLTREGFVNYVKTFVFVVHSHHLTETELAFPYFQQLIPEMPYHFLNVQHDIMAKYLEEISSAIEQVNAPESITSGLIALLLPLSALNEMWHPHIQIEEKNLNIEKIGALLPAEEQVRLITLYTQHSQQHSGPPQLAVPFMLFNLTPDERVVMTNGMPEELLNHLIPVVWKDQWASMIPFLLE